MCQRCANVRLAKSFLMDERCSARSRLLVAVCEKSLPRALGLPELGNGNRPASLRRVLLIRMDYFSKFLRQGTQPAPKTPTDHAQEFHKSWNFIKVGTRPHIFVAVYI